MDNNASCNVTGSDSHCYYCGTAFWTTVNVTSAVVAIFGNLLTISAILLCKQLSSVVSNRFVFSLAVGDFLVGASVPYHMVFYTAPGYGSERSQCLLRFVLTTFACSGSISNLLLIATDRYVAIVYPLHYNRCMTGHASLVLIAAGWATSFTVSAVPFFWNDWAEGVKCEVINVLPKNYLNFVVFPMFVLIWVVMFVLYFRICKEATGHAKRIRSESGSNCGGAGVLRDTKSFQVIMLILGCFTICWLPYFVVTLYERITSTTHATAYEIALNMAVANSSMNPMIYAWKNASFRKAFLCLIKCKIPTNLNSANYITNHMVSKKSSVNCVSEEVKQEEIGRVAASCQH